MQHHVTLSRASPEHATIIQNLVQLYTHDFSEFWAGTSRGDLLPDGRFEAYPLEQYWIRPAWDAFLIGCDGKLAGFALVNDVTRTEPPVNRSVAEFFIVRKHRRHAVGRTAANQLFASFPGSWEIAIARTNGVAGIFWRKILSDLPQVGGVEETDRHDDRWNGQILRFSWLGAKSTKLLPPLF